MLKKKGFIGVAFHKKFFSYKDDVIVPIHVGSKESKENLEYLKDSSGDNISGKNKNFCELTGIYWMWKNIDANFYGMMHYRRYISLENKLEYRLKRILYIFSRLFYLKPIINLLDMRELFQIKISDEKLMEQKIKRLSKNITSEMQKYDVILPKKEIFNKSVYLQYKKAHIVEHLDKLLKIIKEDYEEIYPYYKKRIKKGNKIYPLNVFIMKKEYFFEYSEFIFDVLFKLEKKIKIPSDPYQMRVFGFLSERMMLPFIEYLKDKKNINVKEGVILYLDRKEKNEGNI